MRDGFFRTGAICAVLAAALAVGGCARNDSLMNIDKVDQTPDEFAILPTKPIEIPDDLSSLPPPRPGAANRTDPTPFDDAVLALGGNPARLDRDGSSPDGALVTAASRYGVDSNIRGELAAEDVEFRRRNRGRVLERWFNRNVYFDAYRQQSLDQYDEAERYRRAGAPTSNPPPQEQ